MKTVATTREAPSSGTLTAPTFTLLVCGLGLYLGWQTVGISPTLFPQPNAESAKLIQVASYLQTSVFLVLLLFLAWFAQKHKGLLGYKRIVIASIVLTCASSVCTYLCGWIYDIPIGMVIGTMLGASKAGFFLLWTECLCRVRFRDTLLCVALVYAAAFALCILVTGLREIPALITHSVLPLLSGGALLVLRSDRAFMALQDTRIHEGKPLERLPWRLFVGVGIFGAVILVINTLSETKYPASAELYTLLSGIVVSFTIAVFAMRRSEKLKFTFLYRMLTPLIIASVILVLTLESGSQQYEAIVIGISWAFFRVFTWTLWCNIARRSSTSAAVIFALGQITLTSCSTLAQLVVDNVLPVVNISFPVLISILIAIAVCTSAFVMSESDISQFFSRRKSSKKKSAESEESFEHCAHLAAAEYELSKREEEIALLVMKDKNNTIIQEQLCITESTLRTHLRNIYGKTSVHSRNELIGLLYSFLDEDT